MITVNEQGLVIDWSPPQPEPEPQRPFTIRREDCPKEVRDYVTCFTFSADGKTWWAEDGNPSSYKPTDEDDCRCDHFSGDGGVRKHYRAGESFFATLQQINQGRDWKESIIIVI